MVVKNLLIKLGVIGDKDTKILGVGTGLVIALQELKFYR